MKTITAGSVLKSMPSINECYFNNAIVLISEYNANGAIGFVTNKRFERNLNELVEFKHCRYFPLYEGGPVSQEHIFFIHNKPNLIEEGVPINGEKYVGGNFKKVVSCINEGKLTEDDVQIFVGYCGWDASQLEEELKDGGWMIL